MTTRSKESGSIEPTASAKPVTSLMLSCPPAATLSRLRACVASEGSSPRREPVHDESRAAADFQNLFPGPEARLGQRDDAPDVLVHFGLGEAFPRVAADKAARADAVGGLLGDAIPERADCRRVNGLGRRPGEVDVEADHVGQLRQSPL